MKFVQSVFYFFRIFLASLRAIIDANPNASGERSALRMAAAAFVRHEQSYSVQPDPGPCIKKTIQLTVVARSQPVRRLR